MLAGYNQSGCWQGESPNGGCSCHGPVYGWMGDGVLRIGTSLRLGTHLACNYLLGVQWRR